MENDLSAESVAARWLPLVQPRIIRYLDGPQIDVTYYYGLGEGRGRKRHIGPSDWADDNRYGQAFCGRDMVGAVPLTQAPWQVRGEGWCVTCLRALRGLSDEVAGQNRRHNDGLES